MGRFADLLGTVASSFRFGPKPNTATLDWSALTLARTFALPDKDGTIALNRMIYATPAGNSVSNTTALTNVLSFTVPGGSLGDGTSSCVHMRILGRYRNNNAGATASTLRLQFTFAGVVLWDATSGALTAAAGIHAFSMDLVLQGSGNVLHQNFAGAVVMSTSNQPTTGTGGIANALTAATGFASAINNGSPTAANSAADQTFQLNVAHSVADAATIFQIDSAYVELRQ